MPKEVYQYKENQVPEMNHKRCLGADDTKSRKNVSDTGKCVNKE
jgi:hypothetical protein